MPQPKQLALPGVQRPTAEVICEHWRAILGTATPPPPAPKVHRKHAPYHHGPKAKPIVYEGVTYATWAEACAATGKTADAIRWAMKKGSA